MSDRLNETTEWVNAVVTVWIPLDLPHDAPEIEKLAAAVAAFDELELPTDVVADIGWEDAPA